MKVSVREYKESDRAACIALSRQLAEHYADIYNVPRTILVDQGQWLDGLMCKEGFAGFWVAEVENQVVGFCGLFVNREEGEIEPVVVSSAFRNRGIGTKLIRHAISEAKNRGVRYLSIRPTVRNKEALNLFVRLGFNLVGHIDLFQDLSPKHDRTWKSGIEILGRKLRY
jgi:ribosomal protein S18 acetylase RimI-like enzyme